ncbi:(2Fe-2S)-binding protein [Streptomyces sp. NPDC054784]
MFVCSCFGVTEEQIRAHAEAGACTPRQVASASKAGTDCGSCVRRIQGILGRGGCPRRAGLDQALGGRTAEPQTAPAPVPASVGPAPAAAPATVRPAVAA